MENFIATIGALLASVGGNLIFALVVLLVGLKLVGAIVNLAAKSKALEKVDPAVRTFSLSFIKIGLYVLLAISVIGILGVPMASIIAALASAGVAVGLALQGALSNLAGGIMLLIFRPFQIGDYVDAAGVSGSVKEITLFYTVIITVDNKRITVPNGSLMNTNVVDYSSEEFRRVDLSFSVSKAEKPAVVQEVLVRAAANTPKVLTEPAAPFARLCGGTNEAMEFTVRCWCKSEDYWDVYFDLNQNLVEALGEAGVQAPTVRVQAVR